MQRDRLPDRPALDGVRGSSLAALRRLARSPGAVPVGCALLALAYAACSLHGFSISAWRRLDESAAPELILGRAQGVRSDDWAVWLPWAFAQIAHAPAFPVVNGNLGLGQNMALVVSAPIADPLVLFRPYLWGYFVGPDVGMGWCWGVYVFGFVAAFHRLFWLISGGRSAASLAAAVALLFAPFFQFWSLNSAFLAATVALGVVCAHGLLFCERSRAKCLHGLALGWSAGAFLLTLYPPFQVPAAYFAGFALAGLVLRSRREGRALRWDAPRLAGALLALLVAGFAGLRLLDIAGDAIELMRHSVYPGQRSAGGGESTLWRVFSNNVFPHRAIQNPETFGGNICEAASFVLFFPWVVVLLLRRGRAALRADPLALALLACLALLLAWSLFGLPRALAQASLLAWSPERRAVIGFGLADMALLVAFLGYGPAPPDRSRRFAFVLPGVALALLVALAVVIGGREPGMREPAALVEVGLLVAAQLAIAFLLVRRSASALVLLAATNVVLTGWFNPVVRGGFDYLWSNPVSRAIRELDAAAGGGSSWLVFDDHLLGKLPPVLGARSFAGVYFHPQPQLWERFDPERRQAAIWNRYAHVAFRPGRDPVRVAFGSPQPEVCVVTIDPDDPRLLALPIDYVIKARRGPDPLRRSPNYRVVREVGPYRFYARIGNGGAKP